MGPTIACVAPSRRRALCAADGVSASYSTPVASFDASINSDGFGISGSEGIDWGPLPYVEGHVIIDEDGTIDVGGRAQATIPTPLGIVNGNVEGGYHQQPDGSWGVYGGAEGTLYTPA